MDRAGVVFVAGHAGLVGSAVMRRLEEGGFERIVTADRAELDLAHHEAVRAFFRRTEPQYCVLAAAKVGGILANATYPADFIRENLRIQLAVIDAAHEAGVEKLAYLGSSCIYPKLAAQPIREAALLTGELEPTNAPYAIAKIAGVMMCQSYWRQHGDRFISVMPTNLYGPGDNFDLETSHVLPALLRKFHEAKVSGAPEVVVWGSGTPRRELMHVDDLADALVFLMDHYESPEIINVGTGSDVTIRELAELVREVVGYSGPVRFDRTRPDGTPRKVLNVSKLDDLGWSASIPFREGIASTYEWYVENIEVARL